MYDFNNNLMTLSSIDNNNNLADLLDNFCKHLDIFRISNKVILVCGKETAMIAVAKAKNVCLSQVIASHPKF